jgi:hypothetical protein
MVDKLQDFLCSYIKEQSTVIKGCLVAAFDSRQHYLSILAESLGTPNPSRELQFCQLLANSGLFREENKITRDGRNWYKVFYLTDEGMELAKQIKAEGFSGPVPQNTPVDNL